MPHDFRNKSFQKVLRGYAPEEVDEYIAYLNEEYRKLERRTADSERKLALALKKMDESARNGSADSVGPAAREAAAKLLREAEAERDRIIENARDIALANMDGILEDAHNRADQIEEEAVQKAEAILAAAKAEADAHRDDVKKAKETARSICGEIGSFRERLYALYNDHLDALEGMTDAAQAFVDSMEEEESAEPVPLSAEEGSADGEESLPEPEMPEEDTEEADAEEESAESEEKEFFPEEEPEALDEPEDSGVDEVADNLAFMDRLFASLQADEDIAGEDLYIDIPEEEDYAPEEYAGTEEFGDFEEEEAELPAEEENEDFPAIMIDWKNRSAVSAAEEEEAAEEIPAVEESEDFCSSDGFEDMEEDIRDFEEEEVPEENYDDYRPEEFSEEAETVEPDEEFEEIEEEEETDEYHDMDQIFNEDKSKREMSLTDEFNIIFDDSKSSQNVKEISRQPIVTPENPKNAKKHKKF